MAMLARYLPLWCLLTQSVFTVASSHTDSLGYDIWLNSQSPETRLTVSSATWKHVTKRADVSLSSTPCALESSYTKDDSIAIGTSTAVSVPSSSDASQSQPNSELTTQTPSSKPLGARNQSSASTTIPVFAKYAVAPQPMSCPQWHTGVWMPFDPNEKPYNFNNTLLSYFILCEVNLAAGINPRITDLQRYPSVDSLATCVNLCAQYTMNLPTVESDRDLICHGVTLDVDNTCFLKSRNDSIPQTPAYISGPDGKASAVLSFDVQYNATGFFGNNPPALGDMWPNITKS